MKKTIFTLLIGLFVFGANAQEFEVPKDFKLKKEADYDTLEKDFIKCVDWLMETPVDQKKNKRRKASAFALAWLTGSPKVTIEIDEEIVTFMKEGDYLLVFMYGWAKYSIENDYDEDLVKGNLAGVEAVIAFYKKNKEILGKNRKIEKYIKLKEKGELESYIKKKVKK